jgi:hypothetical protein
MRRHRAGLAVAVLVLAAFVACGQDVPSSGPATYPPSYEPPSAPSASPSIVFVEKPITSVTPGAHFRGITRERLCSGHWIKDHPRAPLTVARKRDILAAYGYPTAWATETGPHRHVTEYDHLLAREDGGNDSIENIWPMTDHDQDQAKDQLENRLHREICTRAINPVTGKPITLRDAWAQLRHFWLYW